MWYACCISSFCTLLLAAMLTSCFCNFAVAPAAYCVCCCGCQPDCTCRSNVHACCRFTPCHTQMVLLRAPSTAPASSQSQSQLCTEQPWLTLSLVSMSPPQCSFGLVAFGLVAFAYWSTLLWQSVLTSPTRLMAHEQPCRLGVDTCGVRVACRSWLRVLFFSCKWLCCEQWAWWCGAMLSCVMSSDGMPCYVQEMKRQSSLLHSQMTPPSSMPLQVREYPSCWVRTWHCNTVRLSLNYVFKSLHDFL